MNFFRSPFVRYVLRKMRLPNDEENVSTAIETIRGGAVLTGANLWVLVCAIFIASLGLNTNSTAVIIGAMLVSPLMGPIMGFGLGLGINDISLLKKSARNFVIMVCISAATSTLYFLISPMKEAGSELLGRTSPTLYDVLIAFFGGIAGIIAGGSKLRRSNVIPGVAIATALMPPLCTMGYGISNLNWQYALGALYLFMINSVFIGIATYLVVNLLGYPKVNKTETIGRSKRTLIVSTLVFLMIAPSVYLTYHIIKKHFYRKNAESFVQNEVEDASHIVVTSKFEYKPGNSKLELVMMGDIIDSTELKSLKSRMRNYGLSDCGLILYQGPDSRAAAKGMFDVLNSDVQLQKLSIRDMYLKLDSLQYRVGRISLSDSLQADIARQMKTMDSTLRHLSVKRTFSYNPGRNAEDTIWTVSVSFQKLFPETDRSRIDSLLKARLKSGEVNIVYE